MNCQSSGNTLGILCPLFLVLEFLINRPIRAIWEMAKIVNTCVRWLNKDEANRRFREFNILIGEEKYLIIPIKNSGLADQSKHAISIHLQEQTDYPTFCIQVAKLGVEKRSTNLFNMIVTYLY
jgi:uncharacterized protein YbcV (DUF1398 family)